MRFFVIGLSLLLLTLLTGCGTPAGSPQQAEPLTYEVIAEGAPPVASNPSSLALAVRGGELPSTLEGLPDEAREALEEARSEGNGSLYLVLYGGQQPSGGHRVELVSLERGAGDELEVTYRVAAPPAGTGAAAVLTYPYLILRVDAPGVDPGQVRFVEE